MYTTITSSSITNRRRGALGIVTLVLLGAIIVGTRAPQETAVTVGPAPAQALGVPASSSSTLALAITPPLPEEQDPEAPNPTEHSPTELRHRVAARRPRLIDYKDLTSKAIRTQAENARLRKLLSDPTMAAAALEDLRALKEETLDEGRQLQRIYSIDLLASFITWKENPIREQVASAVAESVLDDTLGRAKDPALINSLAGDKVELVRALTVEDGEKVEDIYNRSRGGRWERLMKFAWAYAGAGHQAATRLGAAEPASASAAIAD
jgi:hypothetical protein